MVFLAKANSGYGKYALKRMYVNNEYDLNVAKREIQIAVSVVCTLLLIYHTENSIQSASRAT